MHVAAGECGNQLARGLKGEVNVLEPNNQHVHVFSGWPSSGRWVSACQGSMGAVGGTAHWQGHTAPSCWMLEKPRSQLKIARWNHDVEFINMHST